jgi:osmotically-inducible protein OsmY
MSQDASRNPPPLAATDRDCETLARIFNIEGLRLTRTTGVLVMEGQVACYRMKKLAGKAAARLAGAARVVNRLRVVPQSHRRDAELVKAVKAALCARPRLVDVGIACSACHGIVTLRGSVLSSAVRCEAESAAWAVGGMVDVENQLRVRRVSTSNGQAGGDTLSPAARR